MATDPRVLSLNVGCGRPTGHRNAPTTGIDKRPVDAVTVRDPGPKAGGLGSGVVGDPIGDQRHHGGATQAVYAYAQEDQQWWAEQLGRPIAPGGFGENVTTVGVEATRALVGETWRIGPVVLRVEVPRIPCATFAQHMGEKGWVKRFAAAGRTGVYLSVLTPGTMTTGTAIEIVRPSHDIDLLSVFRAVTGDAKTARRVLESGVLHRIEHDYLASTLIRRLR
ncbi:MAG: MOSC domain-containing protein [Terracoccus sp.]